MNQRTHLIIKSFLLAVVLSVLSFNIASAGSLTAPGGAPVSTSYTLADIYNRLVTNVTATLADHSLSPVSVPAATFFSLTQIYNAIPTIDATKVLTGTTYLGVAGSLSCVVPPTPANKTPLKTGQTLCYDNTGATISCTGTGQDGETLKGTARSYTDHSDGTISDNSTGLMWQKCTNGLSGATCATGTATKVTWANALLNCEADTTAGFTDWKLPNINELGTLADYSATGPAINTTYFPNTPNNDYTWSSSQDIYTRPSAVVVHFYDGSVTNDTFGTSDYLRCVRIEASPSSSATAQPLKTSETTCYDTAPFPADGLEISCSGTGQDGQYQSGANHSYTNNDDGTISDNGTGLMWERCEYGYMNTLCDDFDNSETIPSTYLAELAICNNSVTGSYTDWRLPNINELKSLIEYRRFSYEFGDKMAIDTNYFPDGGAFGSQFEFVSSTNPNDAVGVPGWRWIVNYYEGFTEEAPQSNYAIRCVRP